jgi:hypothetical protein
MLSRNLIISSPSAQRDQAADASGQAEYRLPRHSSTALYLASSYRVFASVEQSL